MPHVAAMPLLYALYRDAFVKLFFFIILLFGGQRSGYDCCWLTGDLALVEKCFILNRREWHYLVVFYTLWSRDVVGGRQDARLDLNVEFPSQPLTAGCHTSAGPISDEFHCSHYN